MMIADKIIILKEGEIYAQGKADSIMNSCILKEVYGLQAQVCRFAGFSKPVIVPLEMG
ncbi:hypothetical protein [Halocella sp. SP3-1]|uniref:hypothetical protein n=1 Tax=Halocella sp. SP3-1 TaxID=2382161 RepID=UPI0013DF7200|nr:hypothetical protein [Halocella sp. SP3-1]